MSSPTRFLMLFVAGWVGLRAAALGLVPGSEAFATTPSEAERKALPAIAPTQLAPPDDPVLQPPAAGALPPAYGAYPAYPAYPAYAAAYPAAMPMPQPYAYPVPVYRAVSAPVVRVAEARSEPAWTLEPRRVYPAAQSLDMSTVTSWPEIGASVARPPSAMPEPAAGPPRFDRLQLAAWAMMRDRPGPQTLAGTGTLGGSQAGMRLLYRFNPRLAASLRMTAPLGTARRGGDAAVGVRYMPFAHLPVAVTLERRQGFGEMGGPTGFALFAEGGEYRSFGQWRLDSYLQAGMIAGKGTRMGFVDGQAAITRPFWRNLEIGGGVWGGKQPGLSRLDVGPRVSMKLMKGIRAHADYRFKVAGNAQPGSGAVVTLAGDF